MIFSNGLPIGTGLKIQHPTPVDDRSHVATAADLASLPYKYNGLSCRVANENNRLYVYHLATDTWSAEDITASETISVTPTLSNRTLNVITQQSITSDASGVKFVNDATSPGNNKVYGTNNSGVKGWRNLNLQHFAESTSVFSTRTMNTWEAIGASANINLVLSPKGNGSFTLQTADGTIVGGNIRGSKAVDLQCTRSVNTQVASGNDSFAATRNSTASGAGSAAFCGGIASGTESLAVAGGQATNNRAFAHGLGQATGQRAVAFGGLSSGTESFTAGGSNNRATQEQAAAFGNNTWVTHKYGFGVGLLGRSGFVGSFLIGAGVASFVRGMQIGSLRVSSTSVVPTDVINFINIDSGTGLAIPTDSSHNSHFIEVDVVVNNQSSSVWTKKSILSVYNNNTISNETVIHEFKAAAYNTSSISVFLSGGELRISITADYTGTLSAQAWIKIFGCSQN